MKTKRKADTSPLTIELTDQERAQLQAIADQYGRIPLAATVRMLIAGAHADITPVKRTYAGSATPAPTPSTPTPKIAIVNDVGNLTTAEKHAKVRAALAGLQARQGEKPEPDWGA